jgi:ATP-binding cassette subfamily C protein CydD
MYGSLPDGTATPSQGASPAPIWERLPIDPRLWRQAPAFRLWVIVATLIGVGLTVCLVAQATFLAEVLDVAMFHRGDGSALTLGLIGLLIATLVRTILAFLTEQAAVRAAARTKAQLRRLAVGKLLSLGPDQLSRHHAGELAVTLGHGLDGLDGYVGHYLPRLVLAFIAPLMLLAWVAHLDLLSAGILAMTLVLLPLFMVLIGRLTAARVASRWLALSRLSGQFLDAVEGLAILRAFGRAKVQRDVIRQATEDLRKATMGTLQVALLSALVLETLAAVGTALVAVPLGLRLLTGQVTLTVALTVLVLTPEVFLPLRRASSDFHSTAEGVAALDAVWDLIAEPTQTWASPGSRPPVGNATRQPMQSQVAAASHPSPPPRVELSGLLVTFSGRQEAALSGLDLQLESGEHLGLTGPSGAGKSTLVAVLAGLVRPGSGAVLVDGIELTDADLSGWRRRLTWLPQLPTLFAGTVADNLRLASPSASDAELWTALEVAGLEDLVHSLPGQLQAHVGEQAHELSAGERQRLALARAMVRGQAGLVLLDEPSAHLDPAKEAEVMARLQPALRGRTVLVVSHRRRVLELCDRTLVLVDGRLSATAATPPTLVAG